MLRIMTVHNRYRHQGGEDAVVAQEVRLLRERGHDVRLFTRDNRSIPDGGTFRVAAGAIWSRPAAAALATALSEHGADVVHVHNTFPLLSPSVYYAAARMGIPVVQTLHNFRLICPEATFLRAGEVCTDCLGLPVPWPAIRHACYRNSRSASTVSTAVIVTHKALGSWRRRVDAFIALTEFARAQFVVGGLPGTRIYVRPNHVADPGDPEPDGQEGAESALFVGRLSEEKGVRHLVEAWRGLDRPLLVLGSGPLEEELRSLAPEHVNFAGHVTPAEVQKALKRAAFLVVPSICLEGFPLTVLEAYSAGVPVIAARLGSLAEIVADGETGLLYPAGSATALASCARRLFGSGELRASLGRQARAVYVERYTPTIAYESLLGIYEMVGAAQPT